MNAKRELQHISFLYDQGGLSKIADHLYENVLFDLRHGTNTSAWLEKQDFEDRPPNFEHGIRYRAAATSEIVRGLKIAEKHVDTAQAGFYDMGCGKGKALCIAGMRNSFNSVTGIDYYKPFLDQARSNLKSCGLNNIDLQFNDMAQFEGFKKQSVIFLYNPADEVVIDKIRENLERNTDKAVVIYNKPMHNEVFKDWNLVSKKDSTDPDHRTYIYTHQRIDNEPCIGS